MNILPFESFCLQSDFSFTKAVELIAAQPKKVLADYYSNLIIEPFGGALVFRIQLASVYRSSFLPVITGTAKPNGLGSQIQVEMSLPFAAYAMFLALFVWGITCIFLVAYNAFNGSIAKPLNALEFLPIVVSFPGMALILLVFKLEAYRNRLFLIKRLKADVSA